MNEPLRIRYRFDLPDGSQKTLDFSFDPTTFSCRTRRRAEPPFWTELKFNQCANCPLERSRSTRIVPAALHMAAALEPLKALVSFDTVGVTVPQAERTIYAETTAQQAMSSVLGLIMATSGVPGPTACGRWRAFICRSPARPRRSIAACACISAGARVRGAARACGRGGFAALRGALRESARRESRHVAPLGRRRDAPIRRAMPWRCSTRTRTLLPAALERSLEELKPLFDAWRTRRIFGHLTYRDSL